MNAKKLNEILPIALQKGYLKPTNINDPCLVESLNKANLILYYLQQSDGQGLEMAQMANRLDISEHTVMQYVARLVDLELVTKMVKPGEKGKGIWFLAELEKEEKSESTRTIKSVKAASKSTGKVEVDETGFYFDATPRPNTLLQSIDNLEIRLVRCVEIMALQYMTDDEGSLLPVDQQTSDLELKCLTFLAAVGSVTQLSGGSFVWTGKADFITLPEYRPPLLEAPEWSLQDRITLLKDLARKYLGGLIDNTMTHDFMCAGEQTLALLAEAGICKLVNGSSVFYEFVDED